MPVTAGLLPLKEAFNYKEKGREAQFQNHQETSFCSPDPAHRAMSRIPLADKLPASITGQTTEQPESSADERKGPGTLSRGRASASLVAGSRLRDSVGFLQNMSSTGQPEGAWPDAEVSAGLILCLPQTSCLDGGIQMWENSAQQCN